MKRSLGISNFLDTVRFKTEISCLYFNQTGGTYVLSHSVVSDFFVTLWTVAYQDPLSMKFSRQAYWSRLPFPFPGDLPDPGIEPISPTLQVDSLPLSHWGSPEQEIKAPQIYALL